MANFKRGKPRKQTRHPISNYGRGVNKTREDERPVSQRVKKSKKPKKPWGLEETTVHSEWTRKMFPRWGPQTVRTTWYETETGRDQAYEAAIKPGRYSRPGVTYRKVEREV